MPDITALAKVLRGFDSLIGACERNAGLLVGIEPLTNVLKDLLALVRDLKVEQEDLTGQRKDRTQRLQQAVQDAEEAARQVRNFIKIRLTSRSEQLTQFGIAPLRTRKRRTKLPESPPPPEVKPPVLEAEGEKKKEAPPATTMDANPQ